jgi:hypothetical protein
MNQLQFVDVTQAMCLELNQCDDNVDRKKGIRLQCTYKIKPQESCLIECKEAWKKKEQKIIGLH